jgi:hypothetical protein
LRTSNDHARILKALREESDTLFRINRRIVELGGEPIPPRAGSRLQGRDKGGHETGPDQRTTEAAD